MSLSAADVEAARVKWDAAAQAKKQAGEIEQAAWDEYQRLADEFTGRRPQSFADHAAAGVEAIAQASQ